MQIYDNPDSSPSCPVKVRCVESSDTEKRS
jgi:hypothetical protein